MSGGVGPCNDIPLLEEIYGLWKPPPPSSAATTTTNRIGYLSFQQGQINVLIIVLILSASCLVSPREVSLDPSPKLSFFHPNMVLFLYIFAGVIVGPHLPTLTYIFAGIYVGNKEAIRAAIPHMFLLTSEVFMEGVALSWSFLNPIRVLVPVCYNAMRIFTPMERLASKFAKEAEVRGGGRVLALANPAFWSFNLFGFLLPADMPMAFKKHYSKPIKSQ